MAEGEQGASTSSSQARSESDMARYLDIVLTSSVETNETATTDVPPVADISRAGAGSVDQVASAQRNWTPAEDRSLLRFWATNLSPRRVQTIYGRTHGACKQRLQKLSAHVIAHLGPASFSRDALTEEFIENIIGSMPYRQSRYAWTPSEDQQLLQAVERHGLDFDLVTQGVLTRSREACVMRWYVLNPR